MLTLAGHAKQNIILTLVRHSRQTIILTLADHTKQTIILTLAGHSRQTIILTLAGRTGQTSMLTFAGCIGQTIIFTSAGSIGQTIILITTGRIWLVGRKCYRPRKKNAKQKSNTTYQAFSFSPLHYFRSITSCPQGHRVCPLLLRLQITFPLPQSQGDILPCQPDVHYRMRWPTPNTASRSQFRARLFQHDRPLAACIDIREGRRCSRI